MKCPVCHGDKYKEIKGVREKDFSGNWVLVQLDSGFCPNCRFHYKEGNKDSFEGQVKKYKKIYFLKKIASKEKR